MGTILLSRTRDQMWSLAPSKIVSYVVLANVVVATLIGSFGFVTDPVPVSYLGLTLVLCLVFTLLNDYLKRMFYQSSK